MKRIYVFGLFLTMLLGFGFHAKADLSVTFTWDTPGTMAPYAQIGAISYEKVEVLTTETSQTFTLDDDWGSIKIWPAKGCYFESATTEGGETITPSTWVSPSAGVLSYSPINGYNLNLETYNGQTIHLNIAEVERKDPLQVNVVNGLANINLFRFADSGYTPKLKDGKQTIYYNAEVDGTLLEVQFAGSGEESKPYQFTFNGENAIDQKNEGDEGYSEWENATFKEANAYTHYYTCILDPTADDNYMNIKVFENANDEPDTYTVKITYDNNMQGALSMIYNRTTGDSYYPADFEGGIISELKNLLPGTELRFTFDSDDYNVSEMLVNDTSMKYFETENNGIQQSILLTINENTNIIIKGTVMEWLDITYYGYISNPEGVEFGLSDEGSYNLPYTIINQNVAGKYGDLELPEGSKEIELTVSQKNNGGKGSFFFRPKEGYFISKCYLGYPSDSQTSGTLSVNAAMGYENDGNTFYMLVEKQDPACTATLKVVDSSGYPSLTYIKGAETYTKQNANPAQNRIEITQAGESEFSYIPHYDTPFTLSLNMNQTARIYLDGVAVTGKANSDSNETDYELAVYSPTEEGTRDVHSDVQVWFTGAPAMSTATMKLENNAEAQFYYSPVLHEANPEGQSVITGTYMYVKPTSKNAVVLYKGAVQQLDENGLFGFATGSAEDNTVTVTGPKTIKIAGMIPKSGSTVKSLKQVSLRVPMTADGEEITLDADQEILLQTVVTLNNTNVATVTEIGEPELDETNAQLIVPLILSKEITEAGEDYFVKVPEGAFIQKDWDESKQEFVAVPGGYQTLAYSGRFDVDPDMKSPVEIYTLTPASDETVEEISEVLVSFTEIPFNAWFTGNEFPNATFTCGDKTVEATVTYDWNSKDCRVMIVTPVNADEEPTPIMTKGEWTLTIDAGTFVLDGDESPEITAKYNVEPKYEIETAPSEDGVTHDEASNTTSSLAEISVYIGGASKVDIINSEGATLTNDNGYSETGTITIVEAPQARMRAEGTTSGIEVKVAFENASKTDKTDYKFRMEPGTLKIDDVYDSPAIEKTYTLDTSTGLWILFEDENGNVTVYTLDGKSVLQNKPASSLRELEKGMYIINGKKTYVK